jgi:magnesium and cobalt transporter
VTNRIIAKFSDWVASRFSRGLQKELNDIAVNHDDGEPLTDEERALVAAALRFDEIEAESICVPRSDIVTVDRSDDFKAVLKVFMNCNHSRLPVIDGNKDDVLGFVTIKDILPFIEKQDEFALEKALHMTTFVPEGMDIAMVLGLMKKNHVQMAVVVDEYGGTTGIITLKDIVEELVGEVHDEHETPEPVMIMPMGGGVYKVDPKLEIALLEKRLDVNLTPDLEEDDRDFDTVGGLVFHLAGKVPVKGDSFTLEGGSTLTVTDVDNRRVLMTELKSEQKLNYMVNAETGKAKAS